MNSARSYHETIVSMIEATGYDDPGLHSRALQKYNNNPDAAVIAFWDDQAKYIDEFGWDESAFSLSREGDPPAAAQNQAFVVHSSDDPVILGSAPGASREYLGVGAPSRPPSPLSLATRDWPGRALEIDPHAAGDKIDGGLQRVLDVSKKEYEESMRAKLPPPKPQFGPANRPQFGPAKRQEYPEREWALTMVRHKNDNPDAEPPCRIRGEGLPVFLRCRDPPGAVEHKLGGIMAILHSIPGMRNAFLRLKTGLKPGEKPGEKEYGYGHDPEWWKGMPILPPELQELRANMVKQGKDATKIMPPWEDELHRLVAFLDASERSYGTADILALCRVDGAYEKGVAETDFFSNYALAAADSDEEILTTVVEVGNEELLESRHFKYLEWKMPPYMMAEMQNIYDIWDTVFFSEELDSSRGFASITCPPEVLVFWFRDYEGLEEGQEITIPETFFLDRYMEGNRASVLQSLEARKRISEAFSQSRRREKELLEWVNPKTNKTLKRKDLLKGSIAHCRLAIDRIKSRAAWRQHSTRPDADDVDSDFYDTENHPDADAALEPDELGMVRYYEGKLRQLEKQLADIDRILENIIQAEKEKLRELSRKHKGHFTDPDPDHGWNPTHKYTLQGVVADVALNELFIRKREQEVTEGDSRPSEEWIKMWSPGYNYTVLHETVSFARVSQDSVCQKKNPIFIYATDKAMAEEPAALTDALKTFVNFDNHLFRQELYRQDLDKFESGAEAPRERKRSAGGIEDTTSSESKRLQRSPSNTSAGSVGSVDSMMANRDDSDDEEKREMQRLSMMTEEEQTNEAIKQSLMDLDASTGQKGNAAELEGQPVDGSVGAAQAQQSVSAEGDDSLMDDLIPEQEAKSPEPPTGGDGLETGNPLTLRGGGATGRTPLPSSPLHWERSRSTGCLRINVLKKEADNVQKTLDKLRFSRPVVSIEPEEEDEPMDEVEENPDD